MRFKLKVGAFYTDLNGWCWYYEIRSIELPELNRIKLTGCCYNHRNGGALNALRFGLIELEDMHRREKLRELYG